MSTFVQLSEEDPSYELKGFLDNLDGSAKAKPEKKAGKKGKKDEDEEEESAREPLSKEAKAALLDRFLKKVDALCALPDDQVDSAFALALHAVSELDQKQQASYISKLSTALSSNSAQPLARINQLSLLFNCSTIEADTSLRFNILLSLLNVALQSKNASLVSSFDADTWVKALNLQPSQAAQLYRAVADLHTSEGNVAAASASMYKMLKNMDKASTEAMGSAKDHAAKAALAALASPNMSQFDELLNMAPVKSLEKDKKYANVYQLLTVFASGTVETYLKAYKEQKGLLADTGLNHEENLTKLRILTLSSLAMDQARLSYDVLQQRLALPDASAVESLVIEAVQSGRIDAKIDQENSVIIVSRSTPRAFQQEQWKAMGSKLSQWQRNVQQVLSTLHQIQSRGPAEASS